MHYIGLGEARRKGLQNSVETERLFVSILGASEAFESGIQEAWRTKVLEGSTIETPYK